VQAWHSSLLPRSSSNPANDRNDVQDFADLFTLGLNLGPGFCSGDDRHAQAAYDNAALKQTVLPRGFKARFEAPLRTSRSDGQSADTESESLRIS